MDNNNNSITKLWNGKKIRFREDGYGCLTDMVKAYNEEKGTQKTVKHWRDNKETKAYLEALSAVSGIPLTGLIEVIQGGSPERQGTWGHKQACLRFSQWLDPYLAVWVDFELEKVLVELYQKNTLKAEQSKKRLSSVDWFHEYEKEVAEYVRRNPEKKKGIRSTKAGCQNRISKAISGAKAHDLTG